MEAPETEASSWSLAIRLAGSVVTGWLLEHQTLKPDPIITRRRDVVSLKEKKERKNLCLEISVEPTNPSMGEVQPLVRSESWLDSGVQCRWIILALRRLRQEELGFEASLSDIARPCHPLSPTPKEGHV